MKRMISLFLALLLLLALFGCGKTGDSGSQGSGASSGGSGDQAQDAQASDADGVSLAREDGATVFKVSAEIKLMENSWMGIVPAGKTYATEAEADEDDILWVYPDYGDRSAGDPYRFLFYDSDIEPIEDGDYAMVLCDTDDEGALLLQFPVTIKGSTITPDFTKLRVN